MKNKLKSIQSSIDVWSILLPDARAERAGCAALLTAAERRRADRFARDRDAERFILCRGLRRRILADYLGRDPQTLQFSHNENGKPFLEDSGLEFNVSHSRDRLLIAVTSGRAVGVDIEFRREGIPTDAIAKRWFAPEERDFFQGLENPNNGFFDIWAKKEACVKARGKGIFHQLNSFSVPPETAPGVPGIGKDNRWFFQSLEIDPAYAAALVFEAPAVPVQIRSLRPHE